MQAKKFGGWCSGFSEKCREAVFCALVCTGFQPPLGCLTLRSPEHLLLALHKIEVHGSADDKPQALVQTNGPGIVGAYM